MRHVSPYNKLPSILWDRGTTPHPPEFHFGFIVDRRKIQAYATQIGYTDKIRAIQPAPGFDVTVALMLINEETDWEVELQPVMDKGEINEVFSFFTNFDPEIITKELVDIYRPFAKTDGDICRWHLSALRPHWGWTC